MNKSSREHLSLQFFQCSTEQSIAVDRFPQFRWSIEISGNIRSIPFEWQCSRFATDVQVSVELIFSSICDQSNDAYWFRRYKDTKSDTPTDRGELESFAPVIPDRLNVL